MPHTITSGILDTSQPPIVDDRPPKGPASDSPRGAVQDEIVHEAGQLGDAERHGKESLGARSERRLPCIARHVGGHGDHGWGWVERLRRADNVQPVSVRQPEIRDDEPGPKPLK